MNVALLRLASHTLRLAGIASLACVATAGVAAEAPTAGSVSQDAPAVSAVWQPYELQFHYFGTTTYYSCSGLENRLEELLRQMGADKEVHASVSGCFEPSGIGKMLSAQIRVRMPMTSAEASGESFLATARTVTLRSGRSGDMGAGDCELLEQVRDQILPALKLQFVKDDLLCIPGGINNAGRSLQLMALIPEPINP